MKVYIAASYPRKAEAVALIQGLHEEGHSITSRWLADIGKYRVDKRLAIRDIEDIRRANVLLQLTDGKVQLTRGGRQVELGIAIGLAMPVIILGEKEHIFHALDSADHVYRCQTILEVHATLRALELEVAVGAR